MNMANLVTYISILLCGVFCHTHVNGDDYFKVPLEVREANRPERIVDNPNDPDLLKLKNLQDKFFHIVSNSSAGQGFKSFKQLLHLIDSEAGIELGRIIMNGFMIGVGKENSDQIFMEFLDDFKYRVSPDLTDALLDYKDFLKTVDLKLIPLTIQTLFKKDELGNSLAQIPLGQLVDLVQPEADKYGIDIRSVINGIIGKGDSTFPDMVRKFMKSFNMSTALKGIAESVMDDQEIMSNEVKSADPKQANQVKSKKDPTLMLFKPMIAKLLKEYNIDLEVEAVIQVLTPFVAGGGQLLNNLMKNEDGGFNLMQLAPLLGLLSAQGSKGKSSGGSEGMDMMKTVMSLMNSMGDKNNDMAPLLNMASQFLGGSKSKDNKNAGQGIDGLDLEGIANVVSQMSGGSGLDAGNLLQMASTLMGSGNNKQDGDLDLSPEKLLDVAANLMGGVSKVMETKTETKKGKTFFDILGPFLLRIQKDKKLNTKIKDAVALAKVTFAEKVDINDMRKTLPLLIAANSGEGMPYRNIDPDTVTTILSFSMEDWVEFMNQLAEDEFREMLIKNAIVPAADLVTMMISDEFQIKLNTLFKEKLGESMNMVGLNGRGLTVHNVVDRMRPAVEMLAAGWDLPVKVSSLYNPIKRTLKETAAWYYNSAEFLRGLSRTELEEVVGKSVEHDFAESVVEVAKTSESSQSSVHCLPREVCDLVNDVATNHPESLKLLVTRLSSIFYGALRSHNENNVQILLDVTRAASMGSNCEKYFPIQCPTAVPSAEEAKNSKKTKSENLHEEL